MYINTLLEMQNGILNNIEVIAIGQKGYKTFLDIWLLLHKNDIQRCIGVVRDYDNQEQAKKSHQKYDEKYKNIFVRTTTKYTFEDDFVSAGKNESKLKKYFGTKDGIAEMLKGNKADNMLQICEALIDKKIILDIPKHIKEIIECVKEY